MKKYTILFLIIFLSNAYTKPNYNIGIIIDNKSTETELLLTKLQAQIRAVVGEDAEINFPIDSLLVNSYNLELAKQNYQKLLNNQTDIIISFGIINNEVVSHQKVHKKPTILFGALNQDFNKLDMSKRTSGIKNYTYLVESESYKEDLNKLKQLILY